MKNNIWNKINNKNNRKSNYEISKETNIPEEKVEEIMNGERELPKDRVDQFLEVIQKDDKAKRKVEIEQIKRWFDSTDKKEARIKLGYSTQTAVAKALGVHPSIICRLEKGNREHTSDEMLIKYYDFLTDDLNKVVNKSKVKQTRVSRPRPNRKPKNIKEETKEIENPLLDELNDVVKEPVKEIEDEPKPVEEEPVSEEKITLPVRIWEDITKNNFELYKKVDKLQKQIERYEKLIDRL